MSSALGVVVSRHRVERASRIRGEERHGSKRRRPRTTRVIIQFRHVVRRRANRGGETGFAIGVDRD